VQAAVLGVDDHRGWANFVCLAQRDGGPVVLVRRRVELVSPGVPSQPHHHEGGELGLVEMEPLVRRVEQSVAEHARAALTRIRDDIQPQHQLVAIVIREAKPIPNTLEEVLQSDAARIRADGILYQRVLREAAQELGMRAESHAPGTELEHAARTLGMDQDELGALLKELGRGVGPPWRKDHRLAAAAALSVLIGP
jgi:hypothetical protein